MFVQPLFIWFALSAGNSKQTSAEIDKLALDDVSHPSNLDDLHNGSLENSDLDLTALFEESTEVTEDSKGFIDVDSLLKESENFEPTPDYHDKGFFQRMKDMFQ